MTNSKATFILMKTKDAKVGRIYTMIHKGSVVITRKSLKMDVPYKFWDYNRNRVKGSYPDAKIINKILEERVQEFEILNRITPTEDENQCALAYMKRRIDESPITNSSKNKYNTVLQNFEIVVFKVMRMETLPICKLRDISFVRSLKNEIRKNGNKKKQVKLKSNKSWFNYMSVFASFINDWNAHSGTPYPINVRPFTTDIGKDPKKLAISLTHEELQLLIDYVPSGKKNHYPQTLSKNIFLFQYYTGGIRIQDAMTLTNKDIMSDGFQIKIRKTKEVEKFPFCYEQVETLRDYYPFEYDSVVSTIKTGLLKLSPSIIIQLNRVEGLGDISQLGLKELNNIQNSILEKAKSTPSLQEIIDTFQSLEDELKERITKEFFGHLRKRPINFLFPKLNWDVFSEAGKLQEDNDFSNEQESIIHRARASHNSNLKRISENMGIPKMSGHTPRHSLSNHLYAEGYSIEEIQKVLVHSSINTTKFYLKKRHQTAGVNKTMMESITKFREKRNKFKKGRF